MFFCPANRVWGHGTLAFSAAYQLAGLPKEEQERHAEASQPITEKQAREEREAQKRKELAARYAERECPVSGCFCDNAENLAGYYRDGATAGCPGCCANCNNAATCDNACTEMRTALENTSGWESEYKGGEEEGPELEGLRVQVGTHTKGAALNIKSDVHDLMDIIVRALTVYNVAVTMELRPQEKAIVATVAKVSSAGRVIEADLPNVIEKNVYLMDTYGSLNKATYINKDDPAQRAVYYLDGETGKPAEEPKSRITPVFFKVEYIEGAEDFALEAEQRAREDLTPEDFDNLIEITVHDGDKLIPPEKIRIGEIVTIKANGQSWQSVLTGYEKAQNTHKFVFGYVRVDLDKILRIERRARA